MDRSVQEAKGSLRTAPRPAPDRPSFGKSGDTLNFRQRAPRNRRVSAERAAADARKPITPRRKDKGRYRNSISCVPGPTDTARNAPYAGKMGDGRPSTIAVHPG